MIPFLVGWRQRVRKFYIEPMAGLGELGGRIDIGGDWSGPSIAAVYLASAIGLETKRLDIMLQFKSATGIQGEQAGTWHNESFYFTSLGVG
jgi:hypothetical protein